MEDPAATTSQSTPNPSGGYGNDKEADAKRAQEEQMRRDLLATVLDTAARERCIYAPSFPRTPDSYS
jgi:programmed cell death protein 5